MKEGKDGGGGDPLGERDEESIQGSFAIVSPYQGADTGEGQCDVL